MIKRGLDYRQTPRLDDTEHRWRTEIPRFALRVVAMVDGGEMSWPQNKNIADEGDMHRGGRWQPGMLNFRFLYKKQSFC
jgi:hypothetical protein